MTTYFRIALSLIILTLSAPAWAQVGGNSVYDFVNLPASPRVTAVGGSMIAVWDTDLGLAYHNPALLQPGMHNKVLAGTSINFAGVSHGYFGYARHYDKFATLQGGLQYISYGKFTRTDETGTELGQFNANEFALNVGGGRQVDKYSFGANVKLVYSDLESYVSVGGAIDLAAAWTDTAKNMTAALVIKNVGFQMKPYYSGSREPLPFEIQLGFSKRLKYVPFRFSFVAHNLQRWDLRYDDPNQNTDGNIFLGDTTSNDNAGKKAGDVFDNIARHFIVGGELYLGKSIRLGFGYNHQRRAELRPDVKKGLAGFSFGLGINIKQFGIEFARARYSGSAATTHISVTVDISKFKSRNKKKPEPVDVNPQG